MLLSLLICSLFLFDKNHATPCTSSDLQLSLSACDNPYLTLSQSKKLLMQCPTGFVISNVVNVFYGRSDNKTCFKDNLVSNTKCGIDVAITRPYLSSAASGKSSFAVPSFNTVLFDPCSGTYKWLNITYCCSPKS